jgi:hypothetical protein
MVGWMVGCEVSCKVNWNSGVMRGGVEHVTGIRTGCIQRVLEQDAELAVRAI